MKKFLVLYNAPRAVMEQWMALSPEDQEKGMGEWRAWGKAHGADLVDFGGPLGTNTRITKNGATEAANEIGGYSIVRAESLEDAAKLFSDSPHFASEAAYIELMEIHEM